MNRNDIAKAIAEDLLYNDALDEHNFSYDTAALLEYVQNIILEHLKDYSLLPHVCYPCVTCVLRGKIKGFR